MTLKKSVKTERKQKCKHLFGLSNKNKRVRIFLGLANADANNVISPWNFLESDRHFALTSFEIQECDWAIQLFTVLPVLGVSLAGIRRSFVLMLPNIGPWTLFSRSCESRSNNVVFVLHDTVKNNSVCGRT